MKIIKAAFSFEKIISKGLLSDPFLKAWRQKGIVAMLIFAFKNLDYSLKKALQTYGTSPFVKMAYTV